MTDYTAETLDLSRLDLGPLFDLDYEAWLQARMAKYVEIWNGKRAIDPTLPELDPARLEASTRQIIQEEAADADTKIIAMINDAAKALRLAQANSDALDHLATTFHRTQRKVLIPATESTAAVMESDDDLRSRAQLAPEALADLGLTAGGYIYFVRSAFAAQIKGVRPIRRGGGAVELRLLGRTGNGHVDSPLLAEVIRAFQPEDMTQSTDILTVFSAEIDELVPEIRLRIPRGPDPEEVKAAARKSLLAYRDDVHRIGASVWLEALAAAAKVGPVIRPIVVYPTAHVIGAPERAPWLADFVLTTEVAS
ncbi:MAG: baseplate J/gp47 family protein [Rhizobiaceae bacterium]|nr:baseplate J/gp47 family protein [Rhizobiaceae bacterium]